MQGILYDRTSTPYNFIRKKRYEGYVVQLEKSALLTEASDISDWFYIPPLSTLAQIGGIGEMFHPRTKVFIDAENTGIRSAFDQTH